MNVSMFMAHFSESEVQDCGQNLSAEETPEKNGARFQKAYENCQRQKSIEEKTCKGQSKTYLLIKSK
jgi:hypothetical protein